MRGYSEQLCEVVEPAVTGLGYELVGVQYVPGRKRSLVRIYIDHPAGIGLDDCERVSHQVSGVLDVENPIRDRYDLEISSPGADRPLFKPSHFRQFIGYRVGVKLNPSWEGRKNIVGELVGYESDGVLILENDIEHKIPLDFIGLARLIPEHQ